MKASMNNNSYQRFKDNDAWGPDEICIISCMEHWHKFSYFTYVLKTNTQCHSLYVSDVPQEDSLFVLFLRALSMNQALCHLTLVGCMFSTEQVANLFKNIGQNAQLKTFRLGNSGATMPPLDLLLTQENAQLERLSLWGFGMSEMPAFAAPFHTLKQLAVDIDSRATEYLQGIVEYMRHTPTLSTIELYVPAIRFYDTLPLPLDDFFTVARMNLTSLSFHGTAIHATHMRGLNSLLTETQSLVEISFGSCFESPVLIPVLARGIAKNSTLKKLIFSCISGGDDWIGFVVDAIVSNPMCQITTLSLFRVDMSSESAPALARLFLKNRTIRVLRIDDYSKFQNYHDPVLISAICDNGMLREFNYIDERVQRATARNVAAHALCDETCSLIMALALGNIAFESNTGDTILFLLATQLAPITRQWFLRKIVSYIWSSRWQSVWWREKELRN